ncbi:Ubiquitin carboxyl-terminal hydrolase [Mycena venus]|uniref:Ubiquitin carboxyl-terminal hydrolase n=1 Tax=Mycena venus TaxID=2733690 RepID=A0A8H6WSS5_9AGAR|nr:Ubiquitin carboxyl-terminal hydrolase [Mycena venus]
MDDFPITEAQIVALFLESVFWGFYLVTFVPCLHSILFKSSWELKQLSEINWSMLLVALGVCVFATLDIAIGLMHNIQAFALYAGAGGAMEEFSNISDWVNVVKTVDVVLQTLLGDGILNSWFIYHSASSANKGPTRLRRVMRIILESGLMYTVVALVTFITLITGSNSVYGTSDMSKLSELLFNLPIIRTHQRAEEMSGTTIPLHVFRQPMVSDSMDGARVTVVKNQFEDEGVETDEGGKRS